ncbi:MAG: decaprenyl-phosphate phosphoribosyltransferase [Prevotella sp.]|nr:decaprenyl-phosphate phosphoribosyltransferase [Prevotella sp.]
MYEVLRLIRPLQWFKNTFVLAPLFFSNNLLKWELLLPTLLAFAAFCLVSSSIYCFNDIYDVEADRQHPRKCKRPIASGKVSVTVGYVTMFLCLALALTLTVASSMLLGVSYWLTAIIAGYWLMNVAYCMRLKQYAIIDVFLISMGFVLRVLIGGLAASIFVSEWLVLMTFLLALFLAFAKRKDDYRIFEQTGVMPRKSISGYNAEFIDLSVTIVATITIVCYIMYTMSDSVIERMGTHYLYLTSIWVIAGLLRHLQNMLVYKRSGSPTKALVKDRFIQLCIAGWISSFAAIIYL